MQPRRRVPPSKMPPSRDPFFEVASIEGSFFEVASLEVMVWRTNCGPVGIKTISVNPFVHERGRPYKALIPD